MKTAGIIAEYNPFHSGHAYHIAQTRALGYTHICAVMSENVVQRGDIAILDAHARAKAAIAGRRRPCHRAYAALLHRLGT